VISSTNRNLPEKIKKGEFREDLFYRINVLPIEMPPLRERREDIPLLANHLIEKHSAELNRPGKKLSPELMHAIVNAPWSGNVRELENVIIRGIMFSAGNEICPEDVGFAEGAKPSLCGGAASPAAPYRETKEQFLQQFHKDYIGKILTQTEGNVTQAAKICGMERQALQQLMRRYGIKAEDFR
jgi:DNA-binding NtrC family response regulator